MFDPNTYDPGRTKEFPLENGRVLRVTRTDPYGLWYFHLDRGQLPAWIQGAYSTIEDLQKAVTKYKVEHPTEPEPEPKPDTRPVIKYKDKRP